MAEKANPLQETKVITGIVRFSYLHVFEPEAIGDSDEPKYSVSLIIPKTDKKTIAKIENAVDIAIKNGAKTKFDGKIPRNLKLPLRDGDEERPDDEAYKNSYFVNAVCKTKPGVVDKNCNDIIEQEEVYSGCYGRASITFYPFNTSGNKGVACGLNHIQKIRDGEPLGGRQSADEDFGTYDDEDEEF